MTKYHYDYGLSKPVPCEKAECLVSARQAGCDPVMFGCKDPASHCNEPDHTATAREAEQIAQGIMGVREVPRGLTKSDRAAVGALGALYGKHRGTARPGPTPRSADIIIPGKPYDDAALARRVQLENSLK